MKSLFRIAVLATMLSLSLPTYAHSPLSDSTPKHNATLTESPEQLELTFNGPVTLVEVRLKGPKTDLRLRPDSGETASDFALSVLTLPNGPYKMVWRALGTDGHMMKGTIDFSIAP